MALLIAASAATVPAGLSADGPDDDHDDDSGQSQGSVCFAPGHMDDDDGDDADDDNENGSSGGGTGGPGNVIDVSVAAANHGLEGEQMAVFVNQVHNDAPASDPIDIDGDGITDITFCEAIDFVVTILLDPGATTAQLFEARLMTIVILSHLLGIPI